MIFGMIMLALVAGIAFYHYVQGVFSSMISAALVIFAAVLAVSYHEQVAENVLGVAIPNYAHATALVGLFALSYVFMRLLSDRLVPGNIRLPVLVDKIGAGAFGFVAGLFGAGVLAIAAQLLPIGPSIAGYSRFELKDREVNSVKVPGKYQRQDLLIHDELQVDTLDPSRASSLFPLPVDDVVLGMTSYLSDGGSLAGERPFKSVHPSFEDEQFAFRLGPARGADVLMPKGGGGVNVTATYTSKTVINTHEDFELKAIRGQNPPALPSGDLVPVVIRASVEPPANGAHLFNMGGIRLVLGKRDPRGGGTYADYYPIGTYQNAERLLLTRPDDVLNVDPRTPVDYVFMVEADLLDKAESGYVFPSIAMLEVRRGARMPLENRPIVEGVQPVTGKLGIVEKEKSQD